MRNSGLRLPKFRLAVLIALAGASPSLAAGEASVPAWLEAHVGEGEGQIAPVVLERARALYQRRGVRNPCYFAFDATRPHLRRRFSGFTSSAKPNRSFRAISAGHGGGRDLDGVADFSNGRRCVNYFGNAMDSDLTAGGAYATAETTASFKGYYRASGGGDAVFMRPFLKFDGEGETANARERAIGGHPAVLLRGVCRRKDPASPHADPDGYVPFGKLVNYAGGRSDGCTSWSASDAETIMAMVSGESDDALHLSQVPGHRRRCAGGRGRRGAVARGALLERRMPERHWRSKVLAEGNAQANSRALSGGASRSAAWSRRQFAGSPESILDQARFEGRPPGRLRGDATFA